MAIDDSSPRPARFAEFRTNARVYASQSVMELIASVAIEPRIAVLVDTAALARSKLAKLDRVMLLALDALCYVNVQVVLLSSDDIWIERLQRELPQAWPLEQKYPGRALARVHERFPGVPLIGISDDRTLLDCISDGDRGIAMGASVADLAPNLAPCRDLNVRAALWWLVEVRSRARLHSWT